MKRMGIMLALAMLAGCAGGNKSSDSGAAIVSNQPYFEVKDEQGRIWVVGSVESLSKAKQGQLPETHVTKLGYGPNQETVNFESTTPELEQRLVTQYAAEHPTAGQTATTEPAAEGK